MENEKTLSPPLLTPPFLTYYSRTTTAGINYLKFLNGLLKEVFESNKNKLSLTIGIWTPDYTLEGNSDPKEKVLIHLYNKVKEVINNINECYKINVKYTGKVSESDLDIWIYYHFDHDMISKLRKNYEGVNRKKKKILIIAYLSSQECIIREIQNFKVEFLCVNSPVNSSKIVSSPSDLTEGIYNDLCGSKEDEIFTYFLLYRFLKIIKDDRRKADKEFIERNFDENILTGGRIPCLKSKQYRFLLKQFKCNRDLIEDFAESFRLVEKKKKCFVLTAKGEEYLEALRSALDDFCGKSEYREVWELIKDEKPVILYGKGIRARGPKRFQSHL